MPDQAPLSWPYIGGGDEVAGEVEPSGSGGRVGGVWPGGVVVPSGSTGVVASDVGVVGGGG
ncbi:MAG: hypothetical protein K0M78_00925, partial [Brevundimonas sp.]|nr:hypothetical protein [Brevundimonas sp.]